MSSIPTNVSKSVRDLNPHIYSVQPPVRTVNQKTGRVTFGESKRIRQDTKPLMNKLETEWFNILSCQFPNFPRPRPQSKRYQLCNGVNYTPDFTASSWPDENGPARETAWEVKGKHAWDDAIVKIKMAAHEWPEVCWLFCWKKDGKWNVQKVLP